MSNNKQENDFEVVFLLAAGVVGAFFVGAPVWYVVSHIGKGPKGPPINKTFVTMTIVTGAIAALISFVCKLEGQYFLYQNHEISTWFPVGLVALNLLLLPLCELTRPVWIRHPFFRKKEKREKVF